MGNRRLLIQTPKNTQSLGVVRLCLTGLALIGKPVANPIEATRNQRRIAQRARKIERRLEIGPRPDVVASRPEDPQIQQCVPFRPEVGVRASHFKRRLEVGEGLVKSAADLVCVPALPVDLPGHGKPELVCCLERSGQLLNRRLWCIQRQGAVAGSLRVFERAGPMLRLSVVIREIARAFVEPRDIVAVEVFERLPNTQVERPPLARHKAFEYGLAAQSVAEGEQLG